MDMCGAFQKSFRAHCPDVKIIFDKFRQAGDPVMGKPQGFGLGLHICKRIVERLGGRIWVVSGRREGTCFSFTLPIEPV